MKRGDIVKVAAKGDFSNKPRPALIIQSDAFNEHHPSITVCPITSIVTGDLLFRVPIRADQFNLLRCDSEVEIDKTQAVRRARVGGTIGEVDQSTLGAVEASLRRWLQLS